MNSSAFDGFLCDTRTPRRGCNDAPEVDGVRACGFQPGGVSAPQPALSMKNFLWNVDCRYRTVQGIARVRSFITIGADANEAVARDS